MEIALEIFIKERLKFVLARRKLIKTLICIILPLIFNATHKKTFSFLRNKHVCVSAVQTHGPFTQTILYQFLQSSPSFIVP